MCTIERQSTCHRSRLSHTYLLRGCVGLRGVLLRLLRCSVCLLRCSVGLGGILLCLLGIRIGLGGVRFCLLRSRLGCLGYGNALRQHVGTKSLQSPRNNVMLSRTLICLPSCSAWSSPPPPKRPGMRPPITDSPMSATAAAIVAYIEVEG